MQNGCQRARLRGAVHVEVRTSTSHAQERRWKENIDHSFHSLYLFDVFYRLGCSCVTSCSSVAVAAAGLGRLLLAAIPSTPLCPLLPSARMTSVPRSLWRHTGTPLDAAPLMHLLGATKPDRVDAALVAAFRGRHEGVAQGKKKQIQADMGGITEQETDAVRDEGGCAQCCSVCPLRVCCADRARVFLSSRLAAALLPDAPHPLLPLPRRADEGGRVRPAAERLPHLPPQSPREAAPRATGRMARHHPQRQRRTAEARRLRSATESHTRGGTNGGIGNMSRTLSSHVCACPSPVSSAQTGAWT